MSPLPHASDIYVILQVADKSSQPLGQGVRSAILRLHESDSSLDQIVLAHHLPIKALCMAPQGMVAIAGSTVLLLQEQQPGAFMQHKLGKMRGDVYALCHLPDVGLLGATGDKIVRVTDDDLAFRNETIRRMNGCEVYAMQHIPGEGVFFAGLFPAIGEMKYAEGDFRFRYYSRTPERCSGLAKVGHLGMFVTDFNQVNYWLHNASDPSSWETMNHSHYFNHYHAGVLGYIPELGVIFGRGINRIFRCIDDEGQVNCLQLRKFSDKEVYVMGMAVGSKQPCS